MKVDFIEKQKFNQWGIWIFLIGFFAFMVFLLIYELSTGEILLGEDFSIHSIIFPLALFALLIALFASAYLETRVNKNGIYVRFFPFHFKYHFFYWKDIESMTLTKYKPLLDYGGWGIRLGFKGKAYNASGNIGLKLVFKNNKKLLIGTNQPEEMIRVFQILGKEIHNKL